MIRQVEYGIKRLTGFKSVVSYHYPQEGLWENVFCGLKTDLRIASHKGKIKHPQEGLWDSKSINLNANLRIPKRVITARMLFF